MRGWVGWFVAGGRERRGQTDFKKCWWYQKQMLWEEDTHTQLVCAKSTNYQHLVMLFFHKRKRILQNWIHVSVTSFYFLIFLQKLKIEDPSKVLKDLDLKEHKIRFTSTVAVPRVTMETLHSKLEKWVFHFWCTLWWLSLQSTGLFGSLF